MTLGQPSRDLKNQILAVAEISQHPRAQFPRPLEGGRRIDFLFKRLNTGRQESPNWQRVTALLLSAATSDEVDVADVTIALEMAASMDEGAQKEQK
jgi:hypothetical protein